MSSVSFLRRKTLEDSHSTVRPKPQGVFHSFGKHVFNTVILGFKVSFVHVLVLLQELCFLLIAIGTVNVAKHGVAIRFDIFNHVHSISELGTHGLICNLLIGSSIRSSLLVVITNGWPTSRSWLMRRSTEHGGMLEVYVAKCYVVVIFEQARHIVPPRRLFSSSASSFGRNEANEGSLASRNTAGHVIAKVI